MSLYITSEMLTVRERKASGLGSHLMAPKGGNAWPFSVRVRKLLSGGTLTLMLICPNALLDASDQTAKQKHSKTSAHRIDSGQNVVLAHPEFQVFEQFPAEIKCGNFDLKISVDDPHYYAGEPLRHRCR